MIVFSNETELERHFEFVHNNVKGKRCPLCDKDFVEYPTLILHIRREHNKPEVTSWRDVMNLAEQRSWTELCR